MKLVTGVEDIEQQTRQNLRSTQAPIVQNIPLPDISSIEMPNLESFITRKIRFR